MRMVNAALVRPITEKNNSLVISADRRKTSSNTDVSWEGFV